MTGNFFFDFILILFLILSFFCLVFSICSIWKNSENKDFRSGIWSVSCFYVGTWSAKFLINVLIGFFQSF